MKIYIMTDLEGISGVRRASECKSGLDEYQKACRYLENEVNAAIEGAFEGGATEVLVCDSHGSGFNLDLKNMDKRARYCENNGIKELMALIDESFDGYLNIGHHAKAGTINAFLDHTQCGESVFDYKINGVSYGEIGQQLLLAGDYDVAQLMISGDKAACEESTTLSPDSISVSVKEAYGNNKVNCLPPELGCEMVRKASKEAMSLIGKVKPFKIDGPYDVQLTLTRTRFADNICKNKPFLERLDGRTLRYVTNDIKEILMPF